MKFSTNLIRTKKVCFSFLIGMLFCLNSCRCSTNLEYDPRSASQTFDDATKKTEQGDFQGALRDYGIVLRSRSNANTYTNRAIVYTYLGNYDDAMADFDAAIKIDPNYFEIYLNRGTARASLQRDFKGAIADYDRAISINPTSSKAYNSRGAARRDSGDYVGAIKDLDQAIRIDPNNESAHFNRGNTYNDSGNASKAITDFNYLIKIKPSYLMAYIARSGSYEKLGDIQSAIADVDRVIQLNPKYIRAYYRRASIYASSGDRSQAISDYDRTISLAREQGDSETLQGASEAIKQLQSP